MGYVSKRGVYYGELNKSPYWFIDAEGYKFFFSSATNCQKFEDRRIFHIAKMNALYSNRIGVSCDFTFAAEINLYLITEKRGFYIEKDGVSICRNEIELKVE